MIQHFGGNLEVQLIPETLCEQFESKPACRFENGEGQTESQPEEEGTRSSNIVVDDCNHGINNAASAQGKTLRNHTMYQSDFLPHVDIPKGT